MNLSLRPDVTATDTDDGLILLDQRNGRYWQLNPTGAAVLRELLDGHSLQEAADGLARRSPKSAGRALADVQALVEALRGARLVAAS